jgi:hypothetical protein
MSQDITTTHDTARLKIALAANGRTDVSLSAKEITWAHFCQRLSTPKVGPKDGSYYVRGGDLVEPKRADEHLLAADIAIIDGDSRFDPETGEIHTGAPPLPEAIAAMEDIGVSFFAHTTHSYDPTTDTWKYRILVPARMASPAELDAVVSCLIEQLHARGVYITDVPENRRWSQPWYLPRVGTPEAVSDFRSHRHDGQPMDVQKAVQWLQARHQQRKAEQAITSSPPPPRPLPEAPSVIDAFNDGHGLEYVRGTLEANGYRFMYRDAHGPNGEAYRYMRPGSTTGTAGVVVFKGSRGHWCAYSHHGIEDPLSGHVTDPFDLYATFQHGGDRKAAARALMPPEQSIAERIQAKAQASPIASLTDDIPEAPTAQQAPQPRIRLVMAGELKDEPVTWLIDGLLPASGFAALYGKPGSYKSFAALYLAAMIALGLRAFDRTCSQGDVVYLAGEGGAGLKRRWDALRQHHNLPPDTPIAFVRAQLNLRSTLEDAEALVEAVKAKGLKPKLLVVDTLARAFAGGNENSSEDMGAFIAVIAYVMQALDCAILIVHHSGKDEARGQRGHSSLLGAVDAELEVTKLSDDDSPERLGRLKVTKQKDGEDGMEIGYRMVTVSLSDIDPDAASLALEPLNGPVTPAAKPQKLTGNIADGLNALRKAIANHGETATSNHIPTHVRCVHVDTWRTYFYLESTKDQEAKKKAFQRARDTLKDRSLAAHHGDLWWPTDREMAGQGAGH